MFSPPPFSNWLLLLSESQHPQATIHNLQYFLCRVISVTSVQILILFKSCLVTTAIVSLLLLFVFGEALKTQGKSPKKKKNAMGKKMTVCVVSLNGKISKINYILPIITQ